MLRVQRRHLWLVFDLSRRDFLVRYLGSFFGMYWNVIHPVVMIVIYTVIFSQVMRARLGETAGPWAYSFYLCTGLMLWNMFNESVNRCSSSLLENAAFMRKVSFPPWNVFLVSLLSSWLNFLIASVIFSIFMMLIGEFSLLWFAAYLLLSLALNLFALGIGASIGCLNVFMRDFQQLMSIVLQVWFWFTPIVYLKDHLPGVAQRLLWLNPAYAFVDSAHEILYFKRLPSYESVLLMAGWVVAALAVAAVIYKRTISAIRDEL